MQNLILFLQYIKEAPIIVFQGYEDFVSYELKSRVNIHRLLESKDILEEMATDYELLIYLTTISYETMLPHTWYKIYLNMFSKYYKIPIQFENKIVEKIFDNEYEILKRLKRWIYKKQVNRMRGL